ncbi:hypothetical protein HPB47_007352 [Ixodes persulcatus]|uniref:Uncharacterized protein n=1 Tax=Ixodes persulcatus TaxID=34615 RepID=A0AC60P7I5_IXOPE|nr:hypothetical protein HPB47_007352 [Ixodes persulcatus]
MVRPQGETPSRRPSRGFANISSWSDRAVLPAQGPKPSHYADISTLLPIRDCWKGIPGTVNDGKSSADPGGVVMLIRRPSDFVRIACSISDLVY